MSLDGTTDARHGDVYMSLMVCIAYKRYTFFVQVYNSSCSSLGKLCDIRL